MKLTPEDKCKVAAEVNGEKIISLENGKLFQHIDNEKGEILLYIKSDFEQQEIKIRITKEK